MWPMTAAKMRALGWRNATTKDAEKLVLGQRYIVANRKGTKVEAATCGQNLDGTLFWDAADENAEVELGELSQWPWFKEDAE